MYGRGASPRGHDRALRDEGDFDYDDGDSDGSPVRVDGGRPAAVAGGAAAERSGATAGPAKTGSSVEPEGPKHEISNTYDDDEFEASFENTMTTAEISEEELVFNSGADVSEEEGSDEDEFRF
jgi:hypothetical protein